MVLVIPRSARRLRQGIARSAAAIRSISGTRSYQRYVIVGTARTGSTLLISLLNAHGQVRAFGELFREPDAIGWDLGAHANRTDERVLDLYRSDPCRFLETEVFGRWPLGQKAVGFKIFYYHAREAPHSAVWDYLARNTEIRVLHIKRRNMLAQYQSLRRAHQTDVWSTATPVAGETPPIRLEVDECRRHFAWVRGMEVEADAFFARHRMLQITYEDLLTDQRAAMAEVQAFLGLREEQLSARTARQRVVPLPKAIANYDELKAAFAGSEWAEFFSETID